MVEAAVGAVVVEREGQVVALVVAGHPGADLLAAVEHDHFGGAQPEHVFHEPPQLHDIGREQVHVIEPARIHPACGKRCAWFLSAGLSSGGAWYHSVS